VRRARAKGKGEGLDPLLLGAVDVAGETLEDAAMAVM
jgi:hypothetical protein